MKASAKREKAPITLTLELSDLEAQALRTIMGNITGPDNGPRGVSAQIYHALKDLGIKGKKYHGSCLSFDTWEKYAQLDDLDF